MILLSMFDPAVAERLLEHSHQHDALLNRQSLYMSMPFLDTMDTPVDEAEKASYMQPAAGY